MFNAPNSRPTGLRHRTVDGSADLAPKSSHNLWGVGVQVHVLAPRLFKFQGEILTLTCTISWS